MTETAETAGALIRLSKTQKMTMMQKVTRACPPTWLCIPCMGKMQRWAVKAQRTFSEHLLPVGRWVLGAHHRHRDHSGGSSPPEYKIQGFSDMLNPMATLVSGFGPVSETNHICAPTLIWVCHVPCTNGLDSDHQTSHECSPHRRTPPIAIGTGSPQYP